MLFVRKDASKTWRFGKLADLRNSGFRLGAQIGVNYGEAYEELMRDPEFARTVRLVSTRRNLC